LFKRHFSIAGASPLEDAHTADYLSHKLKQIWDELEFPISSVVMVLRDAAAVMRKTTRISNVPSFDCMAHKIQLVCIKNISFSFYIDFLLKCVEDGLHIDKIKAQIEISRKIVSHFDKSEPFRRLFFAMKSNLKIGESEKGLIQVNFFL